MTAGRGSGRFPPRVALRDLSAERFRELYEKSQVLLVEDALPLVATASAAPHLALSRTDCSVSRVLQLSGQFPEQTEKTFCLENARNFNAGDEAALQRLFRQPERRSVDALLRSLASQRKDWYASFILQEKRHTERSGSQASDCTPSAFQCMLHALPSGAQPPFLPSQGVKHSNCVWFFMGRNLHECEALQGRAEHVDSVTNDGTWHLQVKGSKVWTIRPNYNATWPAAGPDPSLLESFKAAARQAQNGSTIESCEIEVTEGALLVINTRVWYHCTSLPAQQTLSLSLARDFFFLHETPQASKAKGPECEQPPTKQARMEDRYEPAIDMLEMSNKDGLWAEGKIQQGQVILREKPYCICQTASNRAVIPMCCSTCGDAIGSLQCHLQQHSQEGPSTFSSLEDNNLLPKNYRTLCYPLRELFGLKSQDGSPTLVCPLAHLLGSQARTRGSLPSSIVPLGLEAQLTSIDQTPLALIENSGVCLGKPMYEVYCGRKCLLQAVDHGIHLTFPPSAGTESGRREYLQLALREGQYETFVVVQQLVTRSLLEALRHTAANRKRDDSKEAMSNIFRNSLQRFQAVQAAVVSGDPSGFTGLSEAAPPHGKGTGEWWDMVARENSAGRESSSGSSSVDITLTLHGSSWDILGFEVTRRLRVKKVTLAAAQLTHSPSSYVRVGDRLKSVAGVEVTTLSQVEEALRLLRQQARCQTTALFGAGLSPDWVSCDWVFARPRRLHDSKWVALDAGTEVQRLRHVAQLGFRLLRNALQETQLELFDTGLPTEITEPAPPSLMDEVSSLWRSLVTEIFTWEDYTSMLSCVHACSWHLPPGTTVSPLGAYYGIVEEAVGSGSAKSLCQRDQKMLDHGRSLLFGHQIHAERDEEGMPMDLFPSFEGRALYMELCTASTSDSPNCEVVFSAGDGGADPHGSTRAGGHLTASLLALRNIQPGEPLTVGR